MSKHYARELLMVQVRTAMVQVAVHTCLPAKSLGTVFCLHDFFGNGRDFLPVMDLLSTQGYRVIAPDMPGRGDSAYLPAPRNYRPMTLFRILATVLQHYGQGRIVLLGSGWGAGLLLAFLRLAKFDLHRVVLVDPPMLLSLQSLDADRPLVFSDLAEARASLTGSDEFRGLPRAVAEGLADNRLRGDTNGARLYVDPQIVSAARWTKGGQMPLAEMLRPVTVPLMVLQGRPLDSPAATALEQELSGSARVLINGLGTGHRVYFTEPAERLALLGFLKMYHRQGGQVPDNASEPK